METTHRMLDDEPTGEPPATRDFPETPPAAVPPKRIRVSALAKELGIASKELLALLIDLGEGSKTASSALDAGQADRARSAHAERSAPAADSPTEPDTTPAPDAPASDTPVTEVATVDPAPAAVLFVAPSEGAPTATAAPRRRRPRKAAAPVDATVEAAAASLPDGAPADGGPDVTVAEAPEDATAEPDDVREAAEAAATGAARRRRRRGRRGRGGAKPDSADSAAEDAEDDTDQPAGADTPAAEAAAADTDEAADTADADADDADDTEEAGGSASKRRRRRRRRTGSGSGNGDGSDDDPPNTVTHVRETKKDSGRADDDGVKGVKGSTRLEARRQRRRDGRETSRRRPPILTEAEFLARREAVDRVMAVRQSGDRTQIAVLEDGILVEHYVTRASSTSYVGNVYLGRVQNVLPSMEAAFIDIGKGRNGVLYAGEVNWDAAGLEGKSRAIEQAMKSGDALLVQVTKDPIGHKGARLTSQISLPGRFLVYVPGGGMTGISRRLPDTERHRLKSILKKIVPEDAGVIVRTAAEGASEEDLTHDVERLQAEWAAIQKKAAKTSAAPTLVHGEPDLAIRVVRDVFNEDFKSVVVQGDDAWRDISEYIDGVAPDLSGRLRHHTGESDLFHDLRVDEQIMKALDRKVWLPSGGSLIIDRTEAMTVIDVNTGKFVGSGGNLEQTVTRNNLEAAEEIVRQLRLRDVGGIVVIDFIDMVLESNRELVLRRLTECLGRDRTKHQVAEVTSLGLVQMTRKRVGEGLLEAFSDTCEVCHGRGVIVHAEPVDKSDRGAQPGGEDAEPKSKSRRGRKSGARREADVEQGPAVDPEHRAKALAAMAAIHKAAANGEDDADHDSQVAELQLDAVTKVLSGAEVDPDALAAEVTASGHSSGRRRAGTSTAQPVREQAVESAAEPAAQQAAQPPVETPQAAAEEVLAEAVETAELAAAAGAESVEVPAAAPAANRRPRRRRAATRPAGPPTTG